MRASRRLPTSRFQPGIAAMYALTGASPSALAICGFPPLSKAGLPALALALGFAAGLALARAGVLRAGRLADLGLALLGMRPANQGPLLSGGARHDIHRPTYTPLCMNCRSPCSRTRRAAASWSS